MRALPALSLLLWSACSTRAVPDAGSPAPPCPRTVSRAELDAVRQALEVFDGGVHELPVGDGGCWRLEEERWRYGPSRWTMKAVTPFGLRTRMEISLNYIEGAPDRCAAYLEHPGKWVISSAWMNCAERIITCHDEADGGEGSCDAFVIP